MQGCLRLTGNTSMPYTAGNNRFIPLSNKKAAREQGPLHHYQSFKQI